MDCPETVKIKVAPCEGNEAGIVIINKCDYDPAQHELYGVEKKAEGGKGAGAKEKKAEGGKGEK